MIRRVLLLLLVLAVPAFANNYPQVISMDNPTDWYHLGETSGTTANDSVNPALNGTYNGTFTLNQTGIPGYLGNGAVSLDGTSGYVNLSSGNTALRPSTTNNVGWTVEAWVNATAVATKIIVAMGQFGGGSVRAVWLLATKSGGGFQGLTFADASTCGGSNYGLINDVGSYTANTWHYIAMTTLGGGSGTFQHQLVYVDGVLVGTLSSFSGQFCSVTAEIDVGTRLNNVSHELFLSGKPDEVAFYGAELTQAQITRHYQAGLAAHTPWIVRKDQQPANPLKWFLLAGANQP